MRPFAVTAAVRFALASGGCHPRYVCPPCGSSHGSWVPNDRYPAHARVELTPYERTLSLRLAAAVVRGALTLDRLIDAAKAGEDLEELLGIEMEAANG